MSDNEYEDNQTDGIAWEDCPECETENCIDPRTGECTVCGYITYLANSDSPVV